MPDGEVNPAEGLFFARFGHRRDSPTPWQSGITDLNQLSLILEKVFFHWFFPRIIHNSLPILTHDVSFYFLKDALLISCINMYVCMYVYTYIRVTQIWPLFFNF